MSLTISYRLWWRREGIYLTTRELGYGNRDFGMKDFDKRNLDRERWDFDFRRNLFAEDG